MLTSRVWVQQFREWPELGYRVVAFDHRGHGGSTVGTEGHSVEHLARDILAVLEHHDLRDVLLVGHSMGGFAVQMFAARHADIARERVTALGLLSTAARSPVIGGLPRARTALAALSARGPDIGEMFRRPSLGFALARASLGRDAQASHVELTRELLASTSHETRRDAVAGILRFDIEAELPRIDRPTLVLVGSADVLTPPAEARRIARGIPGARLEVIPRAGHMLMLERPDVLRTVLLGWFDARRAAAAQPPITQPPITQPPIAAEGRMRRGPR
jgi:non-heme chloroperoxidase